MYVREAQYWEFVRGARQSLGTLSPDAGLEVVGSLARGELVPPYSDLDLLLVAPSGHGQELRDLVPEIATSMGDLLTIFVDPFCPRGTLCSIYRGPLKVDWFVDEEGPNGRREVWTGHRAPPCDVEAHPWDWLWWLWCKVRAGKCTLAARELSKFWLFLTLKGAAPGAFFPLVPDPSQDDLQDLVMRTLDHLPAQGHPVAREIRHALEQSSNPPRSP